MIKINGIVVNLDKFPDGTYNLKAPVKVEGKNELTFEWFYDGEDELAALIYLKNYYDASDLYEEGTKTKLKMYYVPNARMDRVKNDNEVFTMKYFAELINWLNFDRVVIFDPHSNVAPALLRHCNSLSSAPLIGSILRDEKIDALIFPDEGAHKRYNMDEQYVSFYGKKIRNWETREITGYKLCTETDKELDWLENKTVLIIDDIVATGGTIYKAVQELKRYKTGKIFVYCSHCENQVLSGKLRPLLDSGEIEKLYTTGSIYNQEHPRIETIGIIR